MAMSNDSEPKAAWTGLVKGRVQGVCFRAETLVMANNLSIDGWVRNTRDGHVELLISGSPNALDQMRAWLKEGPAMARVDALELIECPMPTHSGFEIRY